MMGAGSGFTPRLCNDILCIPGIHKIHIALVDIDKNRLSTMYTLIKKLIQQYGKEKTMHSHRFLQPA